LRKVKENIRSLDAFNFFEWGRVFAKHPDTGVPVELSSLSMMTVLDTKSSQGSAFYAIKGQVLALFEALHIDPSTIVWSLPEQFSDIPVLAMFHPTRTAVLVHAGQPIGIVGEFRPKVLQAFGLESRVAMAGFLTEGLRVLQIATPTFLPLQKFPYAVRDISLIFPRSVTVYEVEQLLSEAGTPLLKQNQLFDIYEQAGEKSFAFHLSFGADDRTLSSTEMDRVFDKIVALAEERFGARLRV
ncbi:MAG TPA: hypothetical protein VJH89_00785, partial [Patescibacteria group bacterium]|nr:hypothetical protein [Patescibacteria group bacterium]